MSDISLLKVDQVVELKIEKLSFGGGRGVARYNGFVVFVPYCIPNEIVLTRITKVKKSFAEGLVEKILSPSQIRRDAPCSYYERCGGCNLQHINYESQLEIKQSLFQEALEKSLNQKADVLNILPAEEEFNYRNRIQLHRTQSKIGFHERGSEELIDIKECLICEEPLNHFLRNHRADLPLGRSELFLTKDLKVNVRQKSHQYDSPAFSQVNRKQNEQLKLLVKQFVEDIQPSEVLELYAGSGNLTETLQQVFVDTPITSVEKSSYLVNLARQKKGFEKVNFVEDDATKFLQSYTPASSNWMIVVDPPRTGLERLGLNRIIDLAPSRFLYISCNPMTLVRDLKIICENGYEVKKVRPLDMFPQTDHLESLTLVYKT